MNLPPEGLNLFQFMVELECKLIRDALERSEGSRLEAARLLSLKRTTLVMKMKKYGLMEIQFGSRQIGDATTN